MANELQILKQRQNDIFEVMAKVFGALGAPVRLKLVHFLSQSPLTVEVLASKIDQSVANTSMHLRKMLTEGLVTVENVGQKRLYALSSPVFEFWETFQDFIQKLDPALRMNATDIYGEINWVEDWATTRKLMKNNEILFLDVRPSDEVLSDNQEYPGVIHIAQSDLKNNLSKLPKRKKILVFCRGRMCALSAFSVNYLRENGYKAFRLEESWTRLKNELFTV